MTTTPPRQSDVEETATTTQDEAYLARLRDMARLPAGAHLDEGPPWSTDDIAANA